MSETLFCADLFCGSGGGTTGMIQAADELGLSLNVVAINHWATAIETHEMNHANVRHLCENLECVWPREVVTGGKLHLALFAPECTSHSRASGGRPKSDQSRATAWHVVRWAEELDIENILVENVREFVEWGPLYPDDYHIEKLRGRPIPEKKGNYFRDWVSSLRKRGYRVEYRILNAAYFGATTSRTRFFLQAKKIRDGRLPRITWPEPTHDTAENMFGKPRFRAAREIIDWDLEGKSIYNRPKPLAENTMRRIYAGLQKFSGLPFLIGQQSCAAPRDVSEPAPTVATAGAISLIEPFLVVFRQHRDGASLDEPLSTITTTGKHHGLCEPYVIAMEHSTEASGHARRSLSAENPLPTLTTRPAFGLIKPFLVKYHGSHSGRADGDNRACSIDEPIRTLDTQPRFALCEPFVLPPEGIHRGNVARSMEVPMQTLTQRGGGSLIEPFIVPYYGNSEAVSVDEPLDTVTTRDRFALVSPEMVEFYGIDKGDIVGVLDIRFRMLQPHELSRAMGFPDDYQFAGTKEQKTKQIGNAIEVNMARALCREMLNGYAKLWIASTKNNISSAQVAALALAMMAGARKVTRFSCVWIVAKLRSTQPKTARIRKLAFASGQMRRSKRPLCQIEQRKNRRKMVYVDELKKYPYGPRCFRNGACHMTADSEDELHEIAAKIGLKRAWYQSESFTPHYDLTASKRALAMENGAVFKPAREAARERLEARKEWAQRQREDEVKR